MIDEEILLATVASRVYGTIAVQTAAHSKGGAARAKAIEDACHESVQVAARIVAHVRHGLAQEAVASLAPAVGVSAEPFGARKPAMHDPRFGGVQPTAVRDANGNLTAG